MKKIFALLLIINLFSPVFSLASEVKIVRAENKVEGWLIEDKTLPIVSIKVAFKKSGSAYDPDKKDGLAAYVSGMLDEGAGNLSSEEFKLQLEKNAIILDFSKDKDNFYISLKTLKDKLPTALELLQKAIEEPTFAPGSMKIVREQLITSVKKLNENPEYIAERKWYSSAFKSHPYSKPTLGTEESLNQISKKDLLHFIRNNFARDNIVVSAAGDISEKEFKKVIDKHFTWLPPKSGAKEIEDFEITASGLEHIEMDIPQSIIFFGQQGVKRNDKNFYTAFVMNYIIGGGSFESRLMTEIREKRGLAYNVYTDVDSLQHGAVFNGQAATKSESADEVVSIIKLELEKLAKDGVTEKELKEAKNHLIGSFPLRLDSNERLVDFLNVMQIYALGTDFLDKRNKYIEEVSLEDVNKLAANLIKSDKQIFIKVGKK